eukprot:TRINITY_DN6632_c0_g1_i2.p1 TRINITY_DN6632_c0_g1~~TRINITY_DN6632_c0_g1_i2.p1  ORF type:complete len:197 (-),score=80.56 TRINITY_DN6632_c0_g1_i2:198-788(-)
MPLITQMGVRAVYIMKRLADVALTDTHPPSASPPTRFNLSNIFNFPFFVNFLKDLYFKVIDTYATSCVEKCKDEFYDTLTIYWEASSMLQCRKDVETPEMAWALAREIFAHVKERITTNTITKFYNFFVVPLQHHLWLDVNKAISALTDSELGDLFESGVLKEKVEKDITTLKLSLDALLLKEKEFAQATAALAHS